MRGTSTPKTLSNLSLEYHEKSVLMAGIRDSRIEYKLEWVIVPVGPIGGGI